MKLGINILEGSRYSSCAPHCLYAYISKVMAAYIFPLKQCRLNFVSHMRWPRDYDVIIKLSPEAVDIFYTPFYSNNEMCVILNGSIF